MKLSILYRDSHLIAINKPSGLAVHRGWARDEVVALTLVRDVVGAHVYPVHRLDRGTSGVLVFAADPESARLLPEQLNHGEVDKRYLALVRGVPPPEVRVDRPLAKENGERAAATTDIRRLAVQERYALVEARPLTGRRHQIRRHLKHLSCPIIGDANYGKGEHNRRLKALYGLARLALHAAVLSFTHPRTGARVTLRAPLDEDLRAPLLAMGFDAALLP